MTLEASTQCSTWTTLPVDEGEYGNKKDAWLRWLRGWLQCRLVCFSWFWIMDTDSWFWSDVREGRRDWKWDALCVEVARWRGWGLRSVAFTWSDNFETYYAREVLQASALLASCLDLTLVRPIDWDNILGDLQTYRELRSLVIRCGLYGDFDGPFAAMSTHPSDMWLQIGDLTELILERIHIPVSWLASATRLRRLHLSWIPTRFRNDQTPYRVDIVAFSQFIHTLECLEELHVQGMFEEGEGTAVQTANSRLRDVRFAGYGHDIWLLLESMDVMDTTHFEVELRSDGYDGLVWERVEWWAARWDLCTGKLSIKKTGYSRERVVQVEAFPERTDMKGRVLKGSFKARMRRKQDEGEDMAAMVVEVLKVWGSLVITDVQVGSLPADMKVDDKAWSDLVRLSPETKTLDIEWEATDETPIPWSMMDVWVAPSTKIHPLTQAFLEAGDGIMWPHLTEVVLKGAASERDVADWVGVVRRRSTKQGCGVDDKTRVRWDEEDRSLKDYQRRMRKQGHWGAAVFLRAIESRGDWLASTPS